MKNTTLIFVLLITLISCVKEKNNKTTTETTTEIPHEPKKITEELSGKSNEERKKILKERITAFLKENNTVTEESYRELFKMIVMDYTLNRANDKYKSMIEIAKKTSREKDLAQKNSMYKKLKKELKKIY